MFVDRRSGLIIGLDSSKQRLDYTQEKLRLSEKKTTKARLWLPRRAEDAPLLDGVCQETFHRSDVEG